MEAIETTAPAPESTSETVVEQTPQTRAASVDAVANKDFRGLREARAAERQGKPLPKVEIKPEVQKQPERTLSKRQQETNEAARLAAERATADIRAENERLKAELASRTAPSQPAAEPPAKTVTVPEYKRYAAMADAPKVADFDSLDEHAAAMALFISDKRYEERQVAEKVKNTHDERVKTLVARDDAYRERVAPKGDLTFLNTLQAPVKALRPVESLQPNEPVSALNVLTSKIVESEHAKSLLQHLSDHPDELERFSKLTTPDAVFIEFGKLVALVDSPARDTEPTKLVTSASAPATVLTARNAAPKDPVTAAVKKGPSNFREFRAARQAERAAKAS